MPEPTTKSMLDHATGEKSLDVQFSATLGSDARSLGVSAQSEEIVRTVTGLRPLAVELITGRGAGCDVAIVETSDARFVVRLKSASQLSNFEKESWCLEEAHQRGIPVPRAISTGIVGERAYSLAHFVKESMPIPYDGNRLAVWRKLGSYAAKLNEIPVMGFGSRMISEGHFELATWEQMLSPQLETAFCDDFWIKSGILKDHQEIRLRQSLSELASLQASSGVCQWDICCENALIRNGNFEDVVLLDLEQAEAAPTPYYQLSSVAKTRGFYSEETQAFIAGYGISEYDLERMLPDLKRLSVLQTMSSVRWAQDRNPNWLERNVVNAKEAIYTLLGTELGLGG